jgi:hypothetical protein
MWTHVKSVTPPPHHQWPATIVIKSALSLYNAINAPKQPTLLGLPWRWRQQAPPKCW